jgi:hypothetical protein
MADHGGRNFFYSGGEQEVPADVTHVVIDRSVKIIPREAFQNRRLLVSVETHDGIEIIEAYAFDECISLRGIKLPGVREVGYCAFFRCSEMTNVEFGNKLETIGEHAFNKCRSLTRIEMSTVRTIEDSAFYDCEQLSDVELPAVETIGDFAFFNCFRLQRIAIPLKDNIFPLNNGLYRCTQFNECYNLRTADLMGVNGIRKTIASLLLESWKDVMNQEIHRINQVLPNTPSHEKADLIQEWIESVINRMGHYKAEHSTLLKEDMTQLELAVWKAKLDEVTAHSLEAQPAKKAKIDMENARKERRIVSGADINIIISNVLPFLQLLE